LHVIPYHSFDRCNYPRTRGTVRGRIRYAHAFIMRAVRYLRSLSRQRGRGDTCACRVSQIFPSLFDKYRISSRSTKPQRHENRIREITRVRVGHNTHSSCDNAPRCFRVCIPSCSSLSLSLSLLSLVTLLKGVSSAYTHVEELVLPDRAARTGSRYTKPPRRVTSRKVNRPHARKRSRTFLFCIS